MLSEFQQTHPPLKIPQQSMAQPPQQAIMKN
jgi:hypothetical protein